MAANIRSSMTSLFADYNGPRMITEPGWYFACSTYVFTVDFINKRCKPNGFSKVCIELHSYLVYEICSEQQGYMIITLMMVSIQTFQALILLSLYS